MIEVVVISQTIAGHECQKIQQSMNDQQSINATSLMGKHVAVPSEIPDSTQVFSDLHGLH